MYIPVDTWLRAFLVTLAVEVPFVLWLLRRGTTALPGTPDIPGLASIPSRLRLAALGVFANLATHPIVWFVLPQLLWPDTPEFVATAEGWALAAEAAFYCVAIPGLRPGLAIGVSLLANAASYAIGLAVAAAWPGIFG